MLCDSFIRPQRKKIVSLGQQSEVQIPEVELIDVNHTVAQLLYKAQINQSFTQFGDGYASAGTLNIGDVLDIMIWKRRRQYCLVVAFLRWARVVRIKLSCQSSWSRHVVRFLCRLLAIFRWSVKRLVRFRKLLKAA